MRKILFWNNAQVYERAAQQAQNIHKHRPQPSRQFYGIGVKACALLFMRHYRLPEMATLQQLLLGGVYYGASFRARKIKLVKQSLTQKLDTRYY